MYLALLLWTLFAVVLACFQRDLVNLLFGPFPLDRESLLALRNPRELQTYHVRLEADREQRFFPSAYTFGQEPYSYYALVDLGDKCLLVHLPARHQGNVYDGLLEPFTPFEKEFVLDRCRAKQPDKELLPFRLNMTRPLWMTVVYFRIMPLLLLLAAALWQTVRAARQRFIIRYFQCDGCPR